MSTRKLLKVELSWSDGEVTYLEGDAAVAWDEACRGMAVMSWNRGAEFPALNWQTKRAFTEISPGLFVGSESESVFVKKKD